MNRLIRQTGNGVIILSVILYLMPYGNPLAFETHEVDFINKTDDIIHGTFLDIEITGGNLSLFMIHY